jgi:hypothetical protein
VCNRLLGSPAVLRSQQLALGFLYRVCLLQADKLQIRVEMVRLVQHSRAFGAQSRLLGSDRNRLLGLDDEVVHSRFDLGARRRRMSDAWRCSLHIVRLGSPTGHLKVAAQGHAFHGNTCARDTNVAVARALRRVSLGLAISLKALEERLASLRLDLLILIFVFSQQLLDDALLSLLDDCGLSLATSKLLLDGAVLFLLAGFSGLSARHLQSLLVTLLDELVLEAAELVHKHSLMRWQ